MKSETLLITDVMKQVGHLWLWSEFDLRAEHKDITCSISLSNSSSILVLIKWCFKKVGFSAPISVIPLYYHFVALSLSLIVPYPAYLVSRQYVNTFQMSK